MTNSSLLSHLYTSINGWTSDTGKDGLEYLGNSIYALAASLLISALFIALAIRDNNR